MNQLEYLREKSIQYTLHYTIEDNLYIKGCINTLTHHNINNMTQPNTYKNIDNMILIEFKDS